MMVLPLQALALALATAASASAVPRPNIAFLFGDGTLQPGLAAGSALALALGGRDGEGG